MCKIENTINYSYSQQFFCLFKCETPCHAFITEMLHNGNPRPNTSPQLPAYPIQWERETMLWSWHQKWGGSFNVNSSKYWKGPAKAQSLHLRGSAQPEDLSSCAQIASKALFNIKFPKENNITLKRFSCNEKELRLLSLTRKGILLTKGWYTLNKIWVF